MTAFGQQSEVLGITPRGYVDSAVPSGADGSDVIPVWNTSGFPSLQNLQVGIPVSIDLSPFFTDPGSPPSEIGFHTVSGQDARDAGWNISGLLLTNPGTLVTTGVFQLVALRNGISVLSIPISFSIVVPVGTDVVAPTIPTGITAVPGNATGDITVSFDAPVDLGIGAAAASGCAHVDVLVNNTVVTPSPIVVPPNALGGPTGVNVGAIASPGAPSFTQTGKVWTVSAAGTGIAGVTAEQCLLVDFGVFTGARTFIAKLDSYTAPGAPNAFMGIAIHETAAAGGRFVMVGMRPSDGNVGLVVETRTAPNATSTQSVLVAVDKNGQPLTSAYVKITRAADLQTVKVSYSLDQSDWTDLTTITDLMASGVHYPLVATSQVAGVAATSAIEEVAITNSPRISFTLNSAVQVALQLQAVDANNNASASSIIVVGTPKPPPQNTILFTPGHWLELDNGSGGGGIVGWCGTDGVSGRIKLAKQQGFVGVILLQTISRLETATAGVYTNGFVTCDAIDKCCKANGMQWGIIWSDRAFATAPNYTGTPSPNLAGLPAYWPVGEYAVAPPNTSWGGLQGLARCDRAYSIGRYLALAQAYTARYGSSPNFEHWRGPESAVASSAIAATGYSTANCIAQLQLLYPQLRTAMPNQCLSHSMNYTGSSTLMQSMFATFAKTTCRAGGLGPDQFDYTTSSGTFESNKTHNGFFGNPSYVNVLPCIAELQFKTMQDSTHTAQEVHDFLTSGALSLGGSVQPNYYFWFDTNSTPIIKISSGATSVVSVMASMPVNTVRPSIYS